MKLHQKLFWLLICFLPVQLGRHFWPNFSSVLGLRIDYLSPTFFLTDLLVVLVLVFWLWEKKRGFKTLNLVWFKKNWWVVAFFLFLLLNVFLAQNQGAAFYKLLKIIEFSLLALYITKEKISLRFLVLPLSLGVLGSSLIALLQFFHQGSLNGLFWWLGERNFDINTPGIAKAILGGKLILRPYATFSHPNALAGFLLVGLILTSSFFLKKKRWLTFVYYFLIITALFFSFSRSAWLVGLLVLFWFLITKRKSKQIFWGFPVFLGMVLIFYIFPWFSTNEAFSQRVQLMESAWLMIQNFPLSGVGLNNFVVRLPDYWSLTGFTYWLQPVHNLFFLVGAEVGLPGLLIFIWFLFLTYLRALFSSKNRLLLMALSAILLLGLTDHYWLTLQQNQLLFTLVVGLIWSSQN